jgi:hypothetical protein
MEHSQVMFQKDHFCCGLCDINGAVHGNANIRRMERWCVVNSVANVFFRCVCSILGPKRVRRIEASLAVKPAEVAL